MRSLRFTIRELLALTFVAALGVMAFTSMRQPAIARQELMRLQADLKNYEANLNFFRIQPQFIEQEIDWLGAKAAAFRSAADHISTLQEKYEALEQGDSDTVSFRSVPSIVEEDFQRDSWRVRVLVPDAAEVFLKCGVAPEQNLWSDPEQVAWQQESALDNSGPYEIKLPSGFHDIEVAHSDPKEGEQQRFKIMIDNIAVLVTTFRQPDVSFRSYAGPSAQEPIQFPIGTVQTLGQWEFGLRESGSGSSMLCLWLDGASSGFDSFPVQEEHSEGSP